MGKSFEVYPLHSLHVADPLGNRLSLTITEDRAQRLSGWPRPEEIIWGEAGREDLIMDHVGRELTISSMRLFFVIGEMSDALPCSLGLASGVGQYH